jgi:uncharacterized cupin superfamily protein
VAAATQPLTDMDPFNVFDATLPADDADERPEGFRRRELQVGRLIGGARIGATLYDVPPGQRVGPYHYHYNDEEWLIVLEGLPTLRTPEGERELRPGDLIAFPEGPSGGHDVSNRTDELVRVLLVSTRGQPAVAVYPDSDKVAIWRLAGGEADEIIVSRASAAGYWDDELPSEPRA